MEENSTCKVIRTIKDDRKNTGGRKGLNDNLKHNVYTAVALAHLDDHYPNEKQAIMVISNCFDKLEVLKIEEVGCGGNDDAEMDVWTHKDVQKKKRKNYRDNESGRNIRESAGK